VWKGICRRPTGCRRDCGNVPSMKQRVRRPRDCRPPTEPGITTLSGIVASYVANYRWSATAEHAFYGQPPSLTAAVERAALCVRPDGKRHSHQTRIPRRSLAEANQRLQAAPIASCRSFDELHAVVEEWTRDVPKIGDLAVYDIAHRIGAYLGLEPTLVYLHCGTRVGARARCTRTHYRVSSGNSRLQRSKTACASTRTRSRGSPGSAHRSPSTSRGAHARRDAAVASAQKTRATHGVMAPRMLCELPPEPSLLRL
jgi:hypothetical protein